MNPTVTTKEPSPFDKAWGIFEKISSIASPAPVVHTTAPAPIPWGAIAGIGVVGFLLLKVAK